MRHHLETNETDANTNTVTFRQSGTIFKCGTALKNIQIKKTQTQIQIDIQMQIQIQSHFGTRVTVSCGMWHFYRVLDEDWHKLKVLALMSILIKK